MGSLSGWRRGAALLAMGAPGCVIPLGNPGVADASASADGGAVADTGPPPLTQDAAIPAGSWMNVTANLANQPSQCGNLGNVSAKPGEDLLIAGVSLLGLWGSRDGGASWQSLGTGTGSATITNTPRALVFDPQDSMRYWESGIYGSGGGIYVTTDDGNTFAPLGNSFHDDLVSIDFTDPNRQTLLTGGHEQAQTLNKSTDGGMTWTPIGGGLPANTNCAFPLVIDAQTYLVGCAGYGGGPAGVHRTADGGATWTWVTKSGGGGPPLVASDQSIYWAGPSGGLTRSTDGGQTWTDTVESGVVEQPPIELPDGRIVAVGTQYLLVSADHGVTWKPASAALPYGDTNGVTYSVPRKAFFIWHFTCGSGTIPVPTDAVMRFDFDYQKD